jgi:cell division transport system permease protein
MSEFPSAGRLRQGLASIGRRPLAWAAAVAVAGLAMAAVVLGAMALWSLRPLLEQSSIGPEASLVLDPGTGAAEVEALRTSLSLLPMVSATRFVSRDAALAQIAARTPADRDAIAQLAANPLPDVVVVTFRAQAAPEAIESTVATARKMPRVDGVELDLGWYRKLWALGRVGVVVLAAVAAALVVHAAGWVLVALAVAAPIDARRVQLLWLLGADDRAVRRAPVAASLLTALSVAVVTLLASRAGWLWLDRQVDSVGRLYGKSVRLPWPPGAWVAWFVVAMLVAGLVAGSIRARLRLRAFRRSVVSH